MDTTLTLTVEAKVLGQSRPAITPWEVTLAARAAEDGALCVRDLLTAIVTQEVEAFRERQAQRRLTHVLLPEDIARGAAAGKVDMGGHDLGQPVSASEAVHAALQAFEDHLYYAFLDGQQLQTLDEEVTVPQGGHLMFVRLVALIGG
jgi:hypothetical protein